MEKEKYQEMSPEEVKKFEEENMTEEQKEMSEEKARKFEQREQMPPILIIYRDNDLFEKYVPEIERMLTAQGRRIEVKNFPRGTDKDEIKEWYEGNMEILAGTEIFSDRTASSIPYEVIEKLKKQGSKIKHDLDKLMDLATQMTIWGGEAEEILQENPDWELPPEQRRIIKDQRLKEFYTKIMKYVLGNQENIPNKIYIFSDHILDHIDKESYTGIRYEDQKGNKLFEKKLEELIRTYPEQIKELLIESGIDAEKIIIKSGEPNQKEIQKEIDQHGNWVIIDRHSHIFNYGHKIGGQSILSVAKDLKLPESSFYNSARKAGLIDIPNEKFNQNLEKVIDKELGDQT